MIWVTRFLKVSRKMWLWMVAGIILGMAVIAANTLLMAISGWFIASMAISGSSGTVFNYFFPSGAIRFLAISRTVGRYVERLVSHEATFRILAELRVWLFKRFAPLAPACIERYAAGDVAGRLRADVDALETLYLRILAPLAVGLLSIVAGLLFLLCFSSPSAVVMSLFMLCAGVVLPLLVRSLSEEPGRKSALLSAELRHKVTEGLQGVEELILLGALKKQASVVDALSAQLIDEQKRLGRINGLSFGGMSLFAGTGVAAVLIAGSMQVVSGDIPPANLVMILLFSAALFEAAGMLPSALHQLPAARESASRIFELADMTPPVQESADISVNPDGFDVSINNLSAAYLPGRPVLNDISLSIPTGSCLVLTGASGTGKSLLIEILLRFRNYKGSATVGGAEICHIRRELLQGLISSLPQHPHLFNDTIRKNILLGNDSATEDQLQQVIADCCLDGWVSGLPEGLETSVGDNGSSVSGGEARRIALARALLKDAPILLLDEPTEGLDRATERAVVERLRARFRCSGVTVLVASHRPACLELGDRSINLECRL